MDKNDYDRRALKDFTRKKITTTMIGALDSFEKRFGRLWGQDKNEEDITEQEDRFYQIWSEVREEILDRGNAQIGAANKELDMYNIEKQRYQIKFINRRPNGRD
jgi:hypothetical protein